MAVDFTRALLLIVGVGPRRRGDRGRGPARRPAGDRGRVGRRLAHGDGRGTKGDPLYRIRRLLITAAERITNFGHYCIRVLLYAGKPDWTLLDTFTPR